MTKSELTKLISESISDLLNEDALRNRFDYAIIQYFREEDQKRILYWNVEDRGGNAVIMIHCNLIGQGMLETAIEIINQWRGSLRFYPYKELICMELTVPKVRSRSKFIK